jgi:glucoamylase
MGMGKFSLTVFILVFNLVSVHSAPAARGQSEASLDQWLAQEEPIAIERMLSNIAPPGAAPGAVVASPSKNNPDYFYYWIRDASLTMNAVITLYLQESNPALKSHYATLLLDWVHFSRNNQLTPNPSGTVGEPKFNADGSAFNGAWGRPQDDGPSLRAITLVRLARIWLAEGKEADVRQLLYDGALPSRSVIKEDLEYVSNHWQQTCFDLWEEVHGDHFHTRMVERRALLEGASLAALLGDTGAADWYHKQAKLIETDLLAHWDAQKGIIVETIHRDGGADYKSSGLDAGVILGVLEGDTGDGFLSASDSRVLATARAIQKAFQSAYPINKGAAPGIAIGRYPEDRYDGYSSSGLGNAWFVNTNAFAELYYRAAAQMRVRGDVARAERFKEEGDSFLSRTRYHTDAAGHYSEQMNRVTGMMQGATDLTWSYASVLTAAAERRSLLRMRP